LDKVFFFFGPSPLPCLAFLLMSKNHKEGNGRKVRQRNGTAIKSKGNDNVVILAFISYWARMNTL